MPAIPAASSPPPTHSSTVRILLHHIDVFPRIAAALPPLPGQLCKSCVHCPSAVPFCIAALFPFLPSCCETLPFRTRAPAVQEGTQASMRLSLTGRIKAAASIKTGTGSNAMGAGRRRAQQLQDHAGGGGGGATQSDGEGTAAGASAAAEHAPPRRACCHTWRPPLFTHGSRPATDRHREGRGRAAAQATVPRPRRAGPLQLP